MLFRGAVPIDVSLSVSVVVSLIVLINILPFFGSTASEWDFWLLSKFENADFTEFPVVPKNGTTASDWDFPVLPFFGTTGRVNVLLDVEVGLLLAKKVLNPSLRAFGLYFYIILSVDYHGY